MEIGKILRMARLKAGLTMKSVESNTGIIASVQSKIELGETVSPGFIPVAILADFYNLSLDGLYEASKESDDSPLIASKSLICQHVPVISWVQAGDWNDSTLSGSDFEVITSPFKCSDKSYALKVRGESMTSSSGAKYSFQEGTIIIVDPLVEAGHKSLVVARLEGTNEVTFKQLSIEDGKFLQPLNSQFPIIPIDRPIVICGTVIGSIQGTKN